MKFQITGGDFLKRALKETARDMAKRIKKDMEKINLRVPQKVTVRESVNHPQHYGGADNPYEAIKVIYAWDLNFSLGSALKYICRAGKKTSSKIEDLKKARKYIELEIEQLEKTQ